MDIKERIFTVDITPEDVDESKYNYDIYKSLGISQERVDLITEKWMKSANELKEYEEWGIKTGKALKELAKRLKNNRNII